MKNKILSEDEFRQAVKQLKAEVGSGYENINFSNAYAGYLQLTGIFGSVSLKVTDRGDKKRVELVPQV